MTMDASHIEHEPTDKQLWYYADLAEPLPSVDQIEEMVKEEYLDGYFTNPDGITIGYEVTQVARTDSYPGEFLVEYEITERFNSPLRPIRHDYRRN